MIKRAMMVCLIVTSFGLTLITNAQTCDDFETALDYYLYGEELYADGFLTDAIDAYNCALEIDPADLYAFNSRGLSYLYLDDYELALADFEAIIALDDTASYAWNNRALVHYYYGELDLALEGFTQAIDLGDDDLIPLENRALTYYYQGEYFSAETDLYAVLEIDPTYKDAYLSLAWVYEGMNFGEQHGMFAEWIRLNTTETREVNLSGSVEDEVYDMAEGVVYRLNFSGSAGQTIRVSARANESADVDPLLVLLDGEGMAIASDDDSGVNLDAVISGFALPEDGDYTLLLTHGDSGETGAITVSADLGEEGGIAVANSFATFNLFVNELATVYTTNNDRLNVRSGPGLDFEVIAQLDAGAVVTLIEGPKKVDGFAWWRIRDEAGNDGWSVERVDGEQTLQLALLVGEDAIVTTGGDKLNVRAGAGSSNELVFQLDEGARVTLLDAPEVAGGFQWWHIQTEDGQEGWTIDRFEGDRMLIPAKEVDS